MVKVVKMKCHRDGNKVEVLNVELKKDKNWVSNLLNIIGNHKDWNSFDLIGEDYSIYLITKFGTQWFYYSDTFGTYLYTSKSMEKVVTDVYMKKIVKDITYKEQSKFVRGERHEPDYLALSAIRIFLTEQIAYCKEKEICEENKIHIFKYCGWDIEIEMCVGGNKEHIKFKIDDISLNGKLDFFLNGKPMTCGVSNWMRTKSYTHCY